jgi:hypothetical protein
LKNCDLPCRRSDPLRASGGPEAAEVPGHGLGRPLYEVHVWDLATLVSVSVLVLLVAGTAAYVPARRAASADPLTVLRAE